MTATENTFAHSGTASDDRLAALGRALAWPVVSLLVTGSVHFTLEALWPDLRATFVPAVLGPLLLAYGIWVGYRAAELTGRYAAAVVSAALLGLLPFMLDVAGFGVLLGRGMTAGAMAGAFGWSFVIFGGLLGGGIQRSTLQ